MKHKNWIKELKSQSNFLESHTIRFRVTVFHKDTGDTTTHTVKMKSSTVDQYMLKRAVAWDNNWDENFIDITQFTNMTHSEDTSSLDPGTENDLRERIEELEDMLRSFVEQSTADYNHSIEFIDVIVELQKQAKRIL
jgi:hypothetical protein